MIVARSILFAAFLFLTTLLAGVACLPFLLLSREVNVGLVRWWCRQILVAHAKIIGVQTIIKGKENLPDGPYILAPKHQAMWETLKVNLLLDDPAIVLKKELQLVPIFGWWLARIKMISIDRGAHATALKKMMKDAKEKSDAGRTIVIFPEGTRAPVGEKNPYKPGVAALYKALNVPVVPVALNSGLIWPKLGRTFLPGTITLEFLPPIAPGLDRKAFMAELENRIESATKKLLAETT